MKNFNIGQRVIIGVPFELGEATIVEKLEDGITYTVTLNNGELSNFHEMYLIGVE